MTATTVAASKPQSNKQPIWRRFVKGRGLSYCALAVIGVFWIFPFLWMALGSLKTQREILAKPPKLLPEHASLANFAKWFGELNFGTYFTNSIVVAVITVLGNMVFCSMVGYALAKMDFAGKNILFGAVMVTLMVPSVATFVPLFVMISNMGLANSYAALILPFLCQPIGVFLMRQFISGIPDALMEAARVDGAGELRIFFQIVLPQCGPPLADAVHPHVPVLLEQLPVAVGRGPDRGEVHAACSSVPLLYRPERHELQRPARRSSIGGHPNPPSVRIPAALLHPRCRRNGHQIERHVMKEQYEFPPEFIWGASTAAHQIEGNNVASDWWAREHAERTDLNEPSGDAADSYHRYGEDIRMLADAGLRMYRFSIEWARIEPAEGCFSKAQLLHYRHMIDVCHQNGVEPMVTLNHMTLPQWLAAKGGWLNADAVDYFARYVRYVMTILHDVTWVCTINEPNMVALTRGGTEGSDFVAASLPAPDPDISVTLVEAHRKAREILSGNPRIKSGWTIACQAFHAMPGCEREMEEYQYPREDYFTEAAAGDDFIGVQAYLRTFIGKEGPVPVPEDAERTLTGWEYFPPALGIAIRHTWDVAGHTPIIVTENGIATADDRRRIDYTFDAIAGMRDAMDDGIDVRGYLHWSLLDNYEWGSFAPTFGLASWDKDTFERHPKPSLDWLGSIARTGVMSR